MFDNRLRCHFRSLPHARARQSNGPVFTRNLVWPRIRYVTSRYRVRDGCWTSWDCVDAWRTEVHLDLSTSLPVGSTGKALSGLTWETLWRAAAINILHF
jgi:hypothetical protein